MCLPAGTGGSPSNSSVTGDGHKRARSEYEGSGLSLGSSLHSSAPSSSLLSVSISMMGGGAEEGAGSGDDLLLESMLNLPTATAAKKPEGEAPIINKRARVDESSSLALPAIAATGPGVAATSVKRMHEEKEEGEEQGYGDKRARLDAPGVYSI